jgi:trehalose 6-phosphate phosphatase
MISATPARASRTGTAKPGRRRRRTDGSLATGDGPEIDQALALAEAALASSPAGLVTDLDGTLAPIVTVPSEARPVAGAIEALQALRRRLAVVAVVTGRAAHDARRILGSAGDELLVIGNHGLEWLEPGADAAEMDDALAPLRATLAALLASVPTLPGVEIEDKGLSATIHYRRAPDPETARARLLKSVLGASGTDIEVREGRRSIELRLVGRGDKGTALRAVVQRFGLRGLVVAGDDATDLDMFAAARELRSEGERSAVLGIAGGHEVPPEIAATVDVLLPDPVAFVRLLGRLATTIR